MAVAGGRARRWLLVPLVVAALVPVVAAQRPVDAAPGESQVPAPNPDLAASCGIDIHVILDRSTSIATAGATGQVQAAFRAFTAALRNTGSRISVSDFSTVARLPIPEYTPVTDATIASTFEPYIAGFQPNTYTNWEDAFRVPRFFAPRPDPNRAHLVLFITDGNPNRAINTAQVTWDPDDPAGSPYGSLLPLTTAQTTSYSDNDSGYQAAHRPAIPNANALKAAGSKVLAIAVGAGLTGATTLQRLQNVSGPDTYPDTQNQFDIETTDVYRQPDFTQLQASLRGAAFQLCAPSVNIRKLEDHNADPDVDDLQPGQGWTLHATVAPEPADWVLPPDASGTTAETLTDPGGVATFQWDTEAPTDSTITVSEDPQEGFVNDPDATSCSYITPDVTTPTPLPGFAATDGGFSGTVPPEAIVTCDLVNRIEPAPGIDLEKATNGADADDAPGPFVPIGDPVEWNYVVTNTGNVTLTGIAVTDEPAPPDGITCPQTALPAGAVMTCTASGTAAAGQFANSAQVVATPASGGTVADDDPSHHFGVEPGIDIEKATNGEDADDAPGPYVPVGDPVTWTYVVSNESNVPIAGVAVTDDVLGTIDPASCEFEGAPGIPDPLPVDGSFTCTVTGVAADGQYENVGSVVGDAEGVMVADSDASHHFGEELGIALEKTTNGEDADDPPGPAVAVGGEVVWRYLFSNTGNVPLQFAVSDDRGVLPACPRLFQLLPGRSLVCFAGGTAAAGQYANIGTVVGTAPSGRTVEASDPSHHFGVAAAIDIVKATNDDDANDPPGPLIPVGDEVTWTYVVTNTGNSELTDIEVVDDRIGPVTCPTTVLAAGDALECTATGIAAAGEYTNWATVIGVPPTGGVVRASDPSNHFGTEPAILVRKSTNGDDADEPPGPLIFAGEPVTWTFEVTNGGNTVLTDVAVVDDQLGPVACPQTTLQPAETMECTATGTAQVGEHRNTATATGETPTGEELVDTDPSHHFGALAQVDIEKATNDEDADAPPGPSVPVGDPVTWTYVVTNPGNLDLVDVVVVDDQGVDLVWTGGDDNGNTILEPEETWTYRAAGSATAGQYANVATVTANVALEVPFAVTDSDPSHHFGAAPGLAIDKTVDASSVSPGSTVMFTITVSNTGNVALRDVVVSDEQVPACGRTIAALPAGQSVRFSCQAVVDGPLVNVASVAGSGPDGSIISASDSAAVDTQVQAGGALPRTGSTVLRLLLAAVAALAAGTACVRTARRRQPERLT